MGWLGTHWSAVWLLAAFVLGAGFNMLCDWLKGRRAKRREEPPAVAPEPVENTRTEHERREVFELQKLIDAHEALTEFARGTFNAYFPMEGKNIAGPNYRWRGGVDVRIMNEVSEAGLRLHALEGLVLDDRIRELVRTARASLQLHFEVATVEQAKAAFNYAATALEEAQSALAQRIREIYGRSPTNTRSEAF
ncbi:hypothetical protein LWP59_08860 [Amycolatopsis acidiphila]|uniref:Uncharacterized protein n=1 Tax=Amycolatopsis acidiphila TaxID=715473 RepID=A0A558A549_9PSEU|nr:hypothetical protein [Amycolatopsis acidiphila]TVT19348.1 hypothetical protein FNH06_24640 [Amycolatopsis acidiphila]UIJ61714.1 hypothetical protein LWP59_08860 [Amycolatopsis acidiphila]GHG58262.1 hypothetical protein GCM10017788_10760 [Amycolatopsis acidiphila]